MKTMRRKKVEMMMIDDAYHGNPVGLLIVVTLGFAAVAGGALALFVLVSSWAYELLKGLLT